MGCNCQPQINHSPLSAKLTENLKIATYIFIGYAIVKIIFVPGYNLLNDIILALILYGLFSQLSYLMGFFAIFFILINFIFELLYFLQIIQNIYMGFSSKGAFLIVIIRFINIIIYYYLLKFSFLCSREYKALFVEQKNGGVFEEYQMFTEDFNNNHIKNTSELSYQRLNNNDNEQKGYIPFSGQGQTWG